MSESHQYPTTTRIPTTTSDTLPLPTLAAGVAAGAVLMYLLAPHRSAATRSLQRLGQNTLHDTWHDTSRAVSNAYHQLGRQEENGERVAVDNSPPSEPLNPETDWSTSAQGDDVPTPPDPGAVIKRLIPPALSAIISPQVGGLAAVVQSLRDQTWDPRTRSTALLGAALSLYSLFAKRSALTMGAGMAGTALLAKGTHKAVKAGLAERADRGTPVQIEQIIRIDAKPEQVFDVWADYQNFPDFMANVVQVRELGADLSRWTVKGPAGVNVEWDSILTEHSRPYNLAWRTIPGEKIEQRGEVVLEPARGGTRVTVRISYTPPAGKAGQAIATLLGSNPKDQLRQDLERLKYLLERGVPMHGARKAESARSSAAR